MAVLGNLRQRNVWYISLTLDKGGMPMFPKNPLLQLLVNRDLLAFVQVFNLHSFYAGQNVRDKHAYESRHRGCLITEPSGETLLRCFKRVVV